MNEKAFKCQKRNYSIKNSDCMAYLVFGPETKEFKDLKDYQTQRKKFEGNYDEWMKHCGCSPEEISRSRARRVRTLELITSKRPVASRLRTRKFLRIKKP